MKTPLSFASVARGLLSLRQLLPALSHARLLVVAFICVLMSPGAFAVERYWYAAGGGTPDCRAGNGVWNATVSSWKTADDAVCPGNALWVGGDDAVFIGGGASATIHIQTANPTANRIWAKSGGFMFCATGGARTLTLTSGRFTVDSGSVSVYRVSGTGQNLNVTVPSSGPFIVDGAGTLFVDYSGGGLNNLNAGKIIISGGGTYTAATGNGWATTPVNFTSDFMVISNNSTLRIQVTTAMGANRGITIGEGGGNIRVQGNNPNTISAPITGTSQLTVSGSVSTSVLTLSADNGSFTGPISITNIVTLAVTGGSAIADSCTVNLGDVATPVLRVDTSETIGKLTGGSAASGSVTLNGAGVVLTVGDATDFSYAGNMTGAGNLIKVGSGKMLLTRSAGTAFTGGTTVSVGSLQVNNATGSGTGTGSVTVSTDGTLGGTGIISGAMTLNGTISPGASIGQFNTGTETWNGGGTYQWEVSNVTGTPGTDWDNLNITGNLDVQATTGSKFTIKVVPSAAITGFDKDTPQTWAIASVSGTLDNFDAAKFAVNDSAVTGDLAGGVFAPQSGSGVLNLTFTPNPGPVASPRNVTRTKGIPFKIAVADLLSESTASANGLARELVSVGSAANGTVSVSNGYILYMPANDNNDSFTYMVRDVPRSGDTAKTAQNSVNITVENAVGISRSIAVNNGTATVSFGGIPGYSYEVQRSTNLPTWLTIFTTNAPASGLFQFVDDFNDLGSAPASAFYRLRQP